MAKYNVTFHHKISPTCKCEHSRSNHAGTGAEFGTGACGICGCKAFVLGDVHVADLPSDTVESADKRGVAAMLRAERLLSRRIRLNSITRRMEGHEKSLALRQLVCFPAGSIWQSIVIEPVREIAVQAVDLASWTTAVAQVTEGNAVSQAKVMIPTLHMGGTDPQELRNAAEQAALALYVALQRCTDAAPHGRDYYPQGSDAMQVASRAHEDRMMRLRAVYEEIKAIWDGIEEELAERAARST